MSRNIENKKLELTAGPATIKLSTFKYLNDNNKFLRGFVSIMVYVGGTFSHSWDNVKVVEGKSGELFIAEPQHMVMKNSEKTYQPNFILPKAVKADTNKLLNETFK